jgi:S1-C subfamily serine protease
MIVKRKYLTAALLFVLLTALCLPAFPAFASKAKATGHPPEDQKASQGPRKEITREGNLVIVTKSFAEEVKKDNTIVLSTVAIKSRLNQDGQLQGFQLFQVDQGSAVERMGFKAKDVLTSVNGIPARELEANRHTLENAQGFDVRILRNGKERKIRITIR